MIIPGKEIFKKNIISNIIDKNLQCQPCGIDLTLKGVHSWESKTTIDFDNSQRKQSHRKLIPFDHEDRILLKEGAYLIEFNEKINVPLNMMGQLFVRSSLFRNGCFIIAGVIDAGYKGGLGAMLHIVNPYGVEFLRNARICQCVISQMKDKVVGYSGVYQNSNISD